jgi:hypothetical protein
LEEEQARIESEQRTLQNISTERLSQAEEDLKEVENEITHQLAQHQDLMRALNEDFDQEQGELFLKYSPTIDSCEKQLGTAENEINTSIDSMNQMRERLFELKDNLKSMIVEHASKVTRDEVTQLNNKERQLQQRFDDETMATDELTRVQEITEKMIGAVESKFAEQMIKAEKVIGVLKKSRDKVHAELDAVLSEKNQMSVIHSHREESYYQLMEESKNMKEVYEELSEAMEMYKNYKELRAHNTQGNIPLTHNNYLNKIISVDNILDQEMVDYKALIEKLKQQELELIERHSSASQAISERRSQYNKGLEATKNLSYEINKVFSHVSVPL